MIKSVIVNIFNKTCCLFSKYILLGGLILLFQTVFYSQNTTQIQSFSELLTRPVKLRAELKNVHPRLFFSSQDLPRMRERAKGINKKLWQEVLADLQTLKRPLADSNDEDLYKSGLASRKKETITQYELAFQISQTSFVYLIEGDEKYLEAAKKWTLRACEMPLWGYKSNKPNVDLPPAHLLYAVAFAYDVLFDNFTKTEREFIKNKLIIQARLMYDYFKYKPNKRYTYTQNHTWIPMAGLAIASYVLLDEVVEAQDWAKLSRAVFERTMLAFGTDGYFYESFHYFGFAFRWMIRYFDAHLQTTGENLYLPMKPKFEQMKYFVMHSILPDRENVFDFADIGDGSLNRNKTSKREKVYGEYDILYRFAGIYQDSEAQTVADFIRNETKLGSREPMWAFINHDSELKPAPLSKLPKQIHFKDNDTVFWRSDWSKDATAFAFRCSPPEGHHAARLAKKIPDWRQNTGHAHPDANSFIIYFKGKYLTGDTGYLGIKQTDDHNTILVNGRGQAKDGIYEIFKEVSNDVLDKIRIVEANGNEEYFYVQGDASSAYYADLGLKKFKRHFLYVASEYFVVWDELETDKPSNFTFLLNADREIKLSGNEALFINENALLRVIRISPELANSTVLPQMIQARGLPGSVDKGDAEQRGIQLQTNSVEKSDKFEFLHFLQPILTTDQTPMPIIEKTTYGLKINWANGDEDRITLKSKTRTIERKRNSVDLPRIVFSEEK